MHLGAVGRLRGESAVGARDDVFPADELREPREALGDQDRVLDDVARVGDHPRNEHLALGEPDRFPQVIFVLVARVRCRAAPSAESPKMSQRNGSSTCNSNPAATIALYSVRSAAPTAWKNSSSVR